MAIVVPFSEFDGRTEATDPGEREPLGCFLHKHFLRMFTKMNVQQFSNEYEKHFLWPVRLCVCV